MHTDEDTCCRFCDVIGPVWQEGMVLSKWRAVYRRCPECAHVWVESPAWLESAHEDAIASLDTGIVERNIWMTDVCTILFRTALRGSERLIDHGGGTGLFTRMMRDRGFDCYWEDPWCQNLFARGFEATENLRFDAATCVEVIEHSTSPMTLLTRLAQRAESLVLTTEIISPQTPRLDDWWYYAPKTGQHVSFLTRRSLEIAAEKLGLRLSSNGSGLHVLSKRRVSEKLLRLITRPSRARRLGLFFWGQSLSASDAARLERRLLTDAA